MMGQKDHDENVREAIKAHEQIIRAFFPEATVTVDYEASSANPLGGIDVLGYLNHNRELEFGLGLTPFNGEWIISNATFGPAVAPFAQQAKLPADGEARR